MSTDELRHLLQSLPPAMDDPADRFESVRRRARQRRRGATVAVGGAAASAVLAGAAAFTVMSPSTQSGGDDIATEPPAPIETVLHDPGPLPGETKVIEVGGSVQVTASGSSVVDLGARPGGATAAKVSVVCLTAGRIVYPDGASIACDRPADESEVSNPSAANTALIKLDPNQTVIRFRAPEGVRWKLVANYVRTETSDWGVNAKGETFGVQRDGKMPDLIATYTTDGLQGYAYTKDLSRTPPTSPQDALAQQGANAGTSTSVPVYESDGVTLIGEFRMAE